jgi:hypothetical protein
MTEKSGSRAKLSLSYLQYGFTVEKWTPKSIDTE